MGDLNKKIEQARDFCYRVNLQALISQSVKRECKNRITMLGPGFPTLLLQ
jgi:hypothetical protein